MNEKNVTSCLGLKGRCVIKLFGPDGELKEQRVLLDTREIPNTVTTGGDKYVADQLSDGGEAAMGWMAVGTGTGQGASDNSLATELDRNALDSTTQGTGANDNDVIYVATWAAGDGTGALTEAGIFNNASAGSGQMLCVASYSVINKGAGDSLVITWTFTCGAS